MPSIRVGPTFANSRLRSGQSTPSPPISPAHSPRSHYVRSKSGRMQGNPPPAPPLRTFMRHFFYVVLSVLLRRHKLLLLAPVIYISGMILYMGTVSLDLPREKKPEPPGSIYRSPKVFKNLWPAMQMANSSEGVGTAWGHPYEEEVWLPCVGHNNASKDFSNSNGYIIIEANGGLNQQRLSICNAVAVASLLNATLVIPAFHLNSVWQDSSTFGDIYDEDHFITTLSPYVEVVKRLPDNIMEKVGNMSNIYNFRIKALSPTSFYLDTVLPKLIETGVIRISPFANRLSFDKIPLDIQRLRCRTNFEALRFAHPISKTGNTLVQRMLELSSSTHGKYVAVHLRFEEDMVAFSCCIYDGGEEEKMELDAARERGWRGKFKKPGRVIKPGAFRMDGKCPLTPLELVTYLTYIRRFEPGEVDSFPIQTWFKKAIRKVGMMLRGMGFQNDTPIYLAAGKIYQEEKNMLPLRRMFPAIQTKETLLSLDELEPFKNHSSRLAALDYTVCLYSEVFVTTQGGNFPHFLIGHRRFLNKGHAKTIRPDKRKLALLLDNPSIRWESFSRQMLAMRRHNDVKGHELRKPSASIYTYPAPDCMCLKNSLSIQTGVPLNTSSEESNQVAIL